MTPAICSAVANDGTRCELPAGHPDGTFHVNGEYCWVNLGVLETSEQAATAVKRAYAARSSDRWPRGSLAEEVARIVHAFPDKGRKDDVRALADRIVELERAAETSRGEHAAALGLATARVRELEGLCDDASGWIEAALSSETLSGAIEREFRAIVARIEQATKETT